MTAALDAAPATIRPPIFGWRGAGVTVGIASVLALAQASQLVWATAGSGRAVPWSAALTDNFVETGLWALLVPMVFALARRFPMTQGRWKAHAAVLAVGGLLVSGTYSVLKTAVSQWLIPEDLQPMKYFRGPRPPPRESPSRDNRTAPDERAGRGGREQTSPPFAERVRFLVMRQGSLHLLIYAVIIGVWNWLAQQHRFRERDRQAQELSRQLADARLQALRMQLNPHFLFNTLNAIATLIHRDPRAADEMIACLSDFLRLTLNSANAPENTLARELEFAHRYLDIERLRFGDRLTIHEDIATECAAVMVPTLVLQPLLENAIRHGIEPGEQRGQIHLKARREDGHLVLSVSDTGPGLMMQPGGRVGIGLANTRARLQELHGDGATLELNERQGGGLEVKVRLPWRPGGSAPAGLARSTASGATPG